MDALPSARGPSDLRPHDDTQARSPTLLSVSPVRQLLWSLLTDADVGRLMRVSRATTRHLLSTFAFHEHFFAPRVGVEGSVRRLVSRLWALAGRRSVERPPVYHMREMVDLYARHELRITRLSLPAQYDAPLHNIVTGQSKLPSSLLVLALGEVRFTSGALKRPTWLPPLLRMVDSKGAEQWDADDDALLDDAFHCERAKNGCPVEQILVTGVFHHAIPLRVLPEGLRRLYFNDNFNTPLQPGSIPSSVTYLQLGKSYNQPLPLNLFPSSSSLRHLVLGDRFNRSIEPGVLPPSLRRLSLGFDFNRPLLPGSLPEGIQWLEMGRLFNQSIPPGVLPRSLTHLRLYHFDKPLQMGSLPSQLIHLSLGTQFNQPLLPGILPCSLRQLVLSAPFRHPLVVGALPHGLQWVEFPPYYERPLPPGVIPSTVVSVTLTGYRGELQRGSIPSSVQWMSLPERFDVDPPIVPSSCKAEFWG